MSSSQTAGSGTSTTTSSSASSLVSTLIPVAALAVVYIIAFLVLRAKYLRVYQPRTFLPTLREDERTSRLSDSKFGWLAPFRSIPDEHVLDHQSLDGYFYLRFFGLLTKICFVGCCITFPILFPVNATGGGGQKELDILSFSNVVDKNRYYAHTFVAWIFLSFVIFMITKETMFFINVRHNYMLAPFNASRISSKTVLFTFIPQEHLSEPALKEALGGDAVVARIWMAKDCEKLTEKVEERDTDAMKLENAEIKLIKAANDRRLKWEKKWAKAEKKGKPKPARKNVDTEAGLVSEWMKKTDRPSHRLGKIPLIGKKVDTIDWSRNELQKLIPEIEKDQETVVGQNGTSLPAAFVEFRSQFEANYAFQRFSAKNPTKLDPRAIAVKPQEVIWKNLKIKKTQRKMRVIATATFLTAMIIFWSIPVAVVGAISNINYLTEKVPFLSFINDIPSVILGVVTGLLPSVALSILMALVPIVCRWMAKLSGEVTTPAVELKCQNWYFAFQVIQVFLVTTFSSGAAAVVSKIIENPSSATTLLAQSLPKASNFFISYIIVQGLGIAAGNLINVGALVMLTVGGKFLDKSPRKMYNRYITLAGLGWGSLYPKFACLGVIAISYSCIAPLVLGFATIGFAIVYLAVRYNMFFVLSNDVDTQGSAYAKALQQLMVGVYISEVCLLGLFAINTTIGPIVLMGVFIFLTAVYHAVMRHALKPLTMYLPRSTDGDDQVALFETPSNNTHEYTKSALPPTQSEGRGEDAKKSKKAAILGKLFDPRKFKSHARAKKFVTSREELPSYEEAVESQAYLDPAITSPPQTLWIVRDEMGISQHEVEATSGVIPISDELSTFNEKGKVVWNRDTVLQAPIREKRIDY
ncbi:hypothetical protein EAE99_006384 [Botrytis elliptica]|nr:hypothetical protein EAE99_006384 [Botrytis elliptica]